MPTGRAAPGYATNVFINCPFDTDYESLFHATVFAVIHCGYTVRCALEAEDAGATRIDRLYRLIEECRFGITTFHAGRPVLFICTTHDEASRGERRSLLEGRGGDR